MQILITELPSESNAQGPLEFITLSWHDRCKARSRYQTDKGTDIALSLPRGTMLLDGAVLYNSNERTIIVKALPQDVVVITPANAQEACKVSHHLGNWHRSVEICQDGLIIAEFDNPLADWLTNSGIKFQANSLPFRPNLRCASHD